MNQRRIHTGSRTLVYLVCLLVLAQTSLLWAAEGITGKWTITMDFGGRDSYATLSIAQKPDGTYSGKWGSAAVSNVKFDGQKLTFTRTIPWGDGEFTMEYAGTLKDGKLTGTLSSDRGEFAANAARKKAKLPALGQWDVSFKVQDRDITGRLTLSQQPAGALAGTWDSEFGEHVISNVKCDKDKLTFTRKSTFGQREWESDFEGTVKGHTLAGAFKSERGDMAANGQRVGGALIGEWELTTTSDMGTYTSLLTVDGDMTGSYEMFGGDIPLKNLKLEGNQVTFGLEMGWGDQTFTMDFKGTLDGKTLKGELDSSRGTSDVTGKKIEAASALVGTWELTSESSRGTRTNTLKIRPDMTGTYTGRNNETPISDLAVDGDQVSFKVTMSFNEREIVLDFKGTLDGTTFNGQATTPRGSREFKGKKID